ncbi:ABC transporter permease subunit [Mycoplasma sp. NEAQ87857]|uniref:ABC transporter permease subunit n=1 Tax=Mycoplasma sp. NEAQ87857 TaxID=2683967 RepID=UPI001E5E1803|nr:ABC transporter permease subunit [Mycoplasma sp. NEAQ87857]
MNKIKNKLLKSISQSASFLVILLFIAILITIIIFSIPGLKTYGWSLFSLNFNLNKDQAGIWLPLLITLVLVCFGVILGTFIGINFALFTFYKLNNRLKRIIEVIMSIFSALPSVVFGLFALEIIGLFVTKVLGMKTSLNLVNAIIMLGFMVVPNIFSSVYNALKVNNQNSYLTGIALGIKKTTVVHKIVKKEIKNEITTGIVLAIGRLIGETMALNFILNSQNYDAGFESGFLGFWNSGLKTLSVVIAYNFFSESGGESLKSILYFFGLIIFIITTIINLVLQILNNPKLLLKSKKLQQFNQKLVAIISWIPRKIIQPFISKNQNYNSKIYDIYKQVIEIIAFGLITLFITSYVLFIVINGAHALSLESSSVFSFGSDSTGRAIINTLVIIFYAILITVPFALLSAIYLSEYLNNKAIKNIFVFFIDALNSTPTIIFGIFGLSFFVETLALGPNGNHNASLIAGILTISLVILSQMIRGFYNAFRLVPDLYRINAIALGIKKYQFIFKILLPKSFGMILSVVLTAISKIISESAPLFLTAGLTSSRDFGINLWGQTLTTRLISQLYSNNPNATNIMYECALIASILIVIIVLLAKVVIPNWSNIKLWFNRRKYARSNFKKQTIN